jgi:subtilisin family serine protease
VSGVAACLVIRGTVSSATVIGRVADQRALDEEVKVARQRRPSGKRPVSPKKAARERAAAETEKVTDLSPAEKRAGFTPRTLDRSVIAIPLLRQLVGESETSTRDLAGGGEARPTEYDVVIDLHLEYPGGRERARERVHALVDMHPPRGDGTRPVLRETSQYMFARLRGDEIRRLVELDRDAPPPEVPGAKGARGKRGRPARKGPPPARAIFRIWPDFEVKALLVKSVRTVKADAAHSSFAALGDDVVWAVVDSGVDGAHPHFKAHQNLALGHGLQHYDFTLDDPLAQPASQESALRDDAGHGTHVAGIIAGELQGRSKQGVVRAVSRRWSESGNTETVPEQYDSITGIAPRCRIVSMKVLDADGNGKTSSVIQALDKIQEINGYGRRILIHGVNLSVGYDFDPEWFACGQSPLCVEVDRLVRSGVVVVAAAGNTGYGVQTTEARGNVSSGIPLSINDPGNADLAITVGSTHRDMPYTYGVSYFSSKGPTGDGRLKPDLLAPGEKILSCAAGRAKAEAAAEVSRAKFEYLEQSGTSMAAPHVSGVIAAFLSVRREFIGQPEKVKHIFVESASDLGRDRYFQGNGLVDLMRAIQTV